ncbi:MAG: hypothetical protein JHC84_20170 [Solirubrobacteraceae bacterium]|nr:hypothetical protein [Solirubrobacteraceae bacterium]
MAPDSTSAVGGVTAPADPTTATTPVPATQKPAGSGGDAFGEALKVARGVSSEPAPKPTAPSGQALTRAQQLGIEGGVGAYDVLGRSYARLEGGKVDGKCVNTSGNARNGQIFERIERDGQIFHVYDDRTVRVGAPKPKAPAPAEEPAAATPATTAAPATTAKPAKADNTAGGSAAA